MGSRWCWIGGRLTIRGMSFIEIDGVGLRYELTGTGARTIVLVHEMGGSLESWDEVASSLASGRRVLRYDTRGAGLSSKVRGSLSIDTMVDDLAALLDTLGIVDRVALAGIAVGGAIALQAAARLPHRVSAAVVGSPATGIPADRRPAVLARVDRIESAGMTSAVDDAMANGYAPELRQDEKRFAAFRARWLGNDPGSYAAIYRMLAGMSLQDELAGIGCPVLVIGGSLDRVRPPALAESVARSIPQARYKVLRTGHYMSVATPELVAAAIGDFLDEIQA
jgi:3-oxoadipate enol-lactonase